MPLVLAPFDPSVFRRWPRAAAVFVASLLLGAFVPTPTVTGARAADLPPAAAMPAGASSMAAPPRSTSTPAPSPGATPAEAPPAAGSAPDTRDGGSRARPDETQDTETSTITVTKGGKSFRVTGVGSDREYNSVNDFVHTEPALAAMVVLIVAVVFLSPVLAIALVIGYRWRKARLQSETLVKLAAQGAVAPADAMAAVTDGEFPSVRSTSDAGARTPGGGPPFDYARELQRRATWSDLRKGVLIAAFGLALVVYSALDDGSPNGLGLVLMFVGLGFIVLWRFEDRQFGAGSGRAGGDRPSLPRPDA